MVALHNSEFFQIAAHNFFNDPPAEKKALYLTMLHTLKSMEFIQGEREDQVNVMSATYWHLLFQNWHISTPLLTLNNEVNTIIPSSPSQLIRILIHIQPT